ncbi:MAG: type 1 glutamine amidotransferase domain-containing protein [Pseudomonadota bacterium]
MADMNDAKRGKVACLLGQGFEDSEFRIPVDRLRQAGYEVDIIGTKAGEKLRGDKGKETATTNLGIDDADVDNYLGLLIPGGYSPDKLRADDRFVQFVRDFDATKRPLAAVCHGPQLLLTAELVEGRTLTAWKTIQGDLRQAGARVQDQEVVVDDNWITSRKPDDLEAFAAKLIEELGEEEERTGVQAPNEQALPPLA